MDNTLPCEFVVHLGDGAFNSTAFVNGVGLPDNLKANYKNNLKDFLISNVNLPFHYVGGNIAIAHTFGAVEDTVTGTYVAPNDENAWFIQGILEFADATDVDVSFFSIKRTQESDATEDFQIALNDKPYAAGTLQRFATKDFPISPVDLADSDGVIRLKASIKGNHYGIARLIYRGPLLMGRNARYRVNAVDQKTFDITLTTKLSGVENVFKMFPFSTKYGGVDVQTTDAAGEHHASTNKNQWITSDLATLKRLRITYPT